MNEQMRARVVNILRSEPCRKIAFDLDGTVITGASFLWAAHYVAAGKVGIEVAPQRKGAAASYDTDANKLSFLDPNFGMSTSDQALVVHECVHLWIDSQKKWTSAIRNEMCAYLAGEMFLEAQNMNNPPDSPSIDQAARIVAKRALAGENLNVHPAKSDVSNLYHAIVINPLYAGIGDASYSYGENGIA